VTIPHPPIKIMFSNHFTLDSILISKYFFNLLCLSQSFYELYNILCVGVYANFVVSEIITRGLI
jgi:hypothetical protein